MIMEVLLANDSPGVSTCMSSTTCSRGTATTTCKSATSISAVVVAIAAGALLVLVSVAVCSSGTTTIQVVAAILLKLQY